MVLHEPGNTIHSIRNIWLEVSSVALYASQPLKKDIEIFFTSNGFVKLMDTVAGFSGDQFWSKATWIL